MIPSSLCPGALGLRQEPFEILPGDAFRNVCYYEGSSRNFGRASSDEMCQFYVMYYPEQFTVGPPINLPWMCDVNFPLPECANTQLNRSLTEVGGLPRLFGTERGSEQCVATIPPAAVVTAATPAPVGTTSGTRQHALWVGLLAVVALIL